MFKFLMAISFLALINSAAEAQYYYKDIVSNDDATQLLNKYKAAKIKVISIKNFDNNGEPTPDFICEKRFDKKYNSSELFTRSLSTSTSLFTTRYNNEGKIISTTDSTSNSLSKNIYEYDPLSRLKKVTLTSHSRDEDYVTGATEQHLYFYSTDNNPDSMQKIINHKPAETILFARDAAGNISIEKNINTGLLYYYYYDKAKHVTDIVLTSRGRPGLHPQYVFTFNAAGEITQLISSGSISGNYNTWKYLYEDGLRTIEKLYGKDRKLAGSVEYTYKK